MTKEFVRNVGTICALALVLCASAAEQSVKTGDKPAPSKIADPIRSVLASKPVQISDGSQAFVQIWFRENVPLKSKPSSPSSSLDALAETTLVAALSVEGDGLKDYKDNAVPKGLYTARFVRQPQDGDHLGTADYSYFLALVSPDADKALDTFTKYTPLVKASGKLTPSGHPLIISLRPVSSTEGEFPAISEPAPEHKALRLKLAGKTADGETADLLFDLVFEGHGHIQ